MWEPKRKPNGLELNDPRRQEKSGIPFMQLSHGKKLVVLAAFSLSLCWFIYKLLLAPHSRFVIILASNQGGGVMDWKGPQEWAIEKNSIRNKKEYIKRHGYDLAIKDMSMRKKYAHEWRESWEKVDIIKETMREHPHAEWFWWLDLSTYIMEPSITLDSHIFNNLEANTFRNLSTGFNPLNMKEDIPFLNYQKEINMIIPQDCGGFNLGSFFIRRSEWTERLLDLWWDPVFYEQKHMEWDHKEQDSFENMFAASAWIRNSVAFVGNRKINAYPPGACDEQRHDRQFFYADRDFCVNMAGCQYGRNCYDEMRHYKELSEKLNKKWYNFGR